MMALCVFDGICIADADADAIPDIKSLAAFPVKDRHSDDTCRVFIIGWNLNTDSQRGSVTRPRKSTDPVRRSMSAKRNG
jgi:hypothetical protein